jgi:hypothetical protein
MAKEPGGGLRLRADYRKLNALTKKDPYPIPLIDETMDCLKHAKVFTKLDIRQVFHRIRCEYLLTFRTRYGTFKYRVLPFGITNGPAAFQRLINEVLMDFLDCSVTTYIDDVLVCSLSASLTLGEPSF